MPDAYCFGGEEHIRDMYHLQVIFSGEPIESENHGRKKIILGKVCVSFHLDFWDVIL